jgi:hypothetical protein
MIAHKFFRRAAHGSLTDHCWPQPSAAGEALDGGWQEATDGPLVPCRNGLHACRIDQLSYWISDELWEVELDGEWIETRHALVARRARLVRRVEAWEGAAAHGFAQICWQRAESAATRATQVSPLAREYLESAQQFAREGKAALSAYVGALVCSALGPSDQALATFDAERRAQGGLLAAAAGL